MDVLLLCAGFGTRLRPLTNHVPKCLAPIGNVPLLAIWLDQLSKLEFVSKVYINSHYLSDQIRDFVFENHFNLDVELIIENNILGTTETIRNEIGQSECGEFLIIHGDNFSLQDFAKMYAIFRDRVCNSRLTGVALGFESTDYNNCGFFRYSKKSGKITSFIEKPGYQVEGLANGAIFMVTRELLLKSLEASSGGDFCKDNLPLIAKNLFLITSSEVHMDIGNPVALAKAQCFRDRIGELGLDRSWQEGYNNRIMNFTLSD